MINCSKLCAHCDYQSQCAYADEVLLEHEIRVQEAIKAAKEAASKA